MDDSENATAQTWKTSLDAVCNRLSTQYLLLLRAASSETALKEQEGGDKTDPRAGGGVMTNIKEPTPPLSADASLSSLQTTLASQNICATTSQLLDLIRTLRLSALLMGANNAIQKDTEDYDDENEKDSQINYDQNNDVLIEEELECEQNEKLMRFAAEEGKRYEEGLFHLRNNIFPSS